MSFCEVTISSILVSTHPALGWLRTCLLIARFQGHFLHRRGIMSSTAEIRGETLFLQMTTANFNILLQCPLTLPKNNCSHYIADCPFCSFSDRQSPHKNTRLFHYFPSHDSSLPPPLLRARLILRFIICSIFARNVTFRLFSRQRRFCVFTKRREILPLISHLRISRHNMFYSFSITFQLLRAIMCTHSSLG